MYVVFDLETTGLKSMAHDVIQFAYIAYDNNNNFIKAESLYFYYEGMSWTEEAYEVHKIPLDFLKQYKDKFTENLCKMYSILSFNNVVGHNAKSFDCVFATRWLVRMGMPEVTFLNIVDTMTAFKSLTHRARIKLGELGNLVGVSSEVVTMMRNNYFKDVGRDQAHDATYDTTLTALITLWGIRNGYISIGLPPVTANTQQVELTIDDSGLPRDPNGLLIRVSDKTGTRHIYVSSSKGFNEEPVRSAELTELMRTGRYISQLFTQRDDGTYSMTAGILTLVYTPSTGVTFNGQSFLAMPGCPKILESLQKLFEEEENV